MNITSYNIPDVTFHYIALRALGGLPSSTDKTTQLVTISRSIHSHLCGRALRLMLPEPKGTYRSAGEKVCQELRHFGFVYSHRGQSYRLTEDGLDTLRLLQESKYVDLRRRMAEVHLRTYNNLRAVFLYHLDGRSVWRPVVDGARLEEGDYIHRLLAPTFGERAVSYAESLVDLDKEQSAKALESALTGTILARLFEGFRMKTALFRTLCDRLASMRLINARRASRGGCEFSKTYSPCKSDRNECPWYRPLEVPCGDAGTVTVYLSEPDMHSADYQHAVLDALDVAFQELPSVGGYHAIPDLRDFVCERLMIPEQAFDDALNKLLDRLDPVLSAGLGYEGITAQRKPLIRTRGETQLRNLLRRVK